MSYICLYVCVCVCVYVCVNLCENKNKILKKKKINAFLGPYI